MMRLLAVYLSIVSLIALTGRTSGAVDNQLTPQERRQGFALLFDGKSLTNWHAPPLGDHPGAWVTINPPRASA